MRDQAVGGNTAKVTREHRIARVAPGVLAIVGGKWTTYRVMARDLVDTVLVESGRPPRECRTAMIPLVGSRVETAQVDIDPSPASTRSGAAFAEVRQPGEGGPGTHRREPGLGLPLTDAPTYVRAEVVHACVNEGASRLDDVLHGGCGSG